MGDALDVKKIERVESDLNKLVADRAEEAKNARAEEAAWAESVRRYHQKRRLEFTKEWCRYYQRLARSHASLAAENERKAAHLLVILREKEKTNGSV